MHYLGIKITMNERARMNIWSEYFWLDSEINEAHLWAKSSNIFCNNDLSGSALVHRPFKFRPCLNAA